MHRNRVIGILVLCCLVLTLGRAPIPVEAVEEGEFAVYNDFEIGVTVEWKCTYLNGNKVAYHSTNIAAGQAKGIPAGYSRYKVDSVSVYFQPSHVFLTEKGDQYTLKINSHTNPKNIIYVSKIVASGKRQVIPSTLDHLKNVKCTLF